MMPGLAHEPEGEGCIEEVMAVEEIHACGCGGHGTVDLFLEVVIDAEALQVVDGGHHLPAAPSTSKKSLSYIRDASLVCQCKRQWWWRVRARVYYIFFQKSNDGDTLGPNLRHDADARPIPWSQIILF